MSTIFLTGSVPAARRRHLSLAIAASLALTNPLIAQESIELSGLNGGNGFVVNGIDTFDRSGGAVSAAGDVNGDGIDDVMIGARYADPGGNSSPGESYVVFGNASPLALGPEVLLFDELEDDSNPAGSRLDFTVTSAYIDEDIFAGLAVIADNSLPSDGVWQYRDIASPWTPDPGTLGNASALVLGADSLLRFLPTTDFAGQSATGYTITGISNPALFTVPPTVDNAGNPSYTPAPGIIGNSSFQVQDDGGTANGGENTSMIQAFTIRLLDNVFADSFESLQFGQGSDVPINFTDSRGIPLSSA